MRNKLKETIINQEGNMSSNNKSVIEVSTKDINKLLDAYNIISSFLEQHVKLEVLYKKEFIKGMQKALDEVSKNGTKKVETFKDFCC